MADACCCKMTTPTYQPGLHWFATLVMAATFVLLLAGGNVTSRSAGMAVPDWPLSFGSVNPPGWTGMPGVRDEHGHRLVGATVGFLVTWLAIWAALRETRRWVKWMALAMWLGVVVQGVMGGLRVLDNSIALAVAHGCFAQMFFCLTIAMVVVTSRAWLQDRESARSPDRLGTTRAEDVGIAASTWAAVVIILIQLVLGAVLRHTQWSWIPHVGWAFVVGLSLMTSARYIFGHPFARQRLGSPMISLLISYLLQLILGLGTLVAIYPMWFQGLRAPQNFTQVWLPTVHLATGATILGISMYLAVRAIGMRAAQPGKVCGENAGARPEGVPA